MTDTIEFTEIKLSKSQMLRFSCTSSTTITLVDGYAEIFGTDLYGSLTLPKGFFGTIVSFPGCTLKYTTNTISHYTLGFDEDHGSPVLHLNFHIALENERRIANNDLRGPRVMICGNENVGKTTLCRTLANYATRADRKVILVDANVGMNDISIPGTISAVVVDQPAHIVEGWDVEEDPLFFSFGHLSPMNNLPLFTLQINTLAELVNIRSENDPEVFVGGCIINISGVRNGYESQKKEIEAIKTAVLAFEVNALLVIEDGFLENLLKNNIPDYVTIIRIPKSSGAIARTPEQMDRDRNSSITKYFYGVGTQKSQPHKKIFTAKDVKIFKIEVKKSSSALLPNDDSMEEEWYKIIEVPFSKQLTNRIVSISLAEDIDEIPGMESAGFLAILSVSTDNSAITVLSPSDAEIPNNLFVLTDLQYVDM